MQEKKFQTLFQVTNRKVVIIVIMFIMNLIFWGYIIFGNADEAGRYFIQHSNFSDFFTPMQKTFENAYQSPHFSNYPPLANLFFLLLKRLGTEGGNLKFFDDTALGICFILFISLSVLSIYEMGKRYLKKDNSVINALCLLLLLVSGPFLFLYSRGNILLGIIPLLMIFVKYYDSDNQFLRELALISLAIATAIKIFPVFFGFFLIRNKEWRSCFKAILYGSILFFGPFLFFGLDSVPLFFQNLLLRDNSTSYNYVLNHTIGIKGAFQMFIGVAFKRIVWDHLAFIQIVFMAAMVYVFIVSKVKWKQCFAVSMLCIWVFNGSYLYNVCLLIISLLLFLEDTENRIIDYIYTLLFGLLFSVSFLPDAGQLNILLAEANLGYVSWSIIVINVILIVLAAIVVADAAVE